MPVASNIRPLQWAWLFALWVAPWAVGCAADPADHATDTTGGSVHAFVTVARTDNGRNSVRAEAVVGFAQVPAAVDARAVLSLVGLRRELPEVGQCVSLSPRDPSPSLATIDRVELLEAGNVSVEAAGQQTRLAPHAFPTVTDLISGVLYTSRDRSAEPLPAAARYRVLAAGGTGQAPVAAAGEAPVSLEGVVLGGVPIFNLNTVALRKPVDIVWKPGTLGSAGDGVNAADAGSANGDVVYAEIASPESSESTVCSFRDEDGVGTIPASAWSSWAAPGSGRVGLHRFRSRASSRGSAERTELRFDFAVETSVTFVE